MIFTHSKMTKKEGSFSFNGNVSATSHTSISKDIFSDLWHGFTFHISDISISSTDNLIFKIGSAKELTLDSNAYAINVDPTDTQSAL